MKNPGYPASENQSAPPKRYSSNVRHNNINNREQNNTQNAVSINVKYKPSSNVKN